MNENKNLKIRFKFENVKILEPIKEDWQIIARIESDFFIQIDNKILYQETFFNIAEFAISVSKWLAECKIEPKDYYFETIDSDEIGIVWFKHKENKWQVGSIHQNYEETHFFDFVEIEDAIENFSVSLLSSFQKNIKQRLEKILENPTKL